MIHWFGKYCQVDDDVETGKKIAKPGLYIGKDGDYARIKTPQDARNLAKFLLEWAEKQEGEK